MRSHQISTGIYFNFFPPDSVFYMWLFRQFLTYSQFIFAYELIHGNYYLFHNFTSALKRKSEKDSGRQSQWFGLMDAVKSVLNGRGIRKAEAMVCIRLTSELL